MIMTLMKKAIRSLILALAVVFLAGSCTKSTAVNTIVISGEWELVHVLIYDANNYSKVVKTIRPSDQGLRTYYNFISGGQLEYREIDTRSNIEVNFSRGSWAVDQNTLIIKLAGAPLEYHIDTANRTDLILFRDYDLLEAKVHEVTTLKKY